MALTLATKRGGSVKMYSGNVFTVKTLLSREILKKDFLNLFKWKTVLGRVSHEDKSIPRELRKSRIPSGARLETAAENACNNR